MNSPQHSKILASCEAAFATAASLIGPLDQQALTEMQQNTAGIVECASSHITDWLDNEGKNDAQCHARKEALDTLTPLLLAAPVMLHLLAQVASLARNGRLDAESTVVGEVETLLAATGIQPLVPQQFSAMELDPKMSLNEIVLQMRDRAERRGMAYPGELIAADDIEKVGSVLATEVLGDYDDPENEPEMRWVQHNASYLHSDNGQDGVWEFLLNLALDFDDVPEKFKPVIEEAKRKNLGYLLIHQGT